MQYFMVNYESVPAVTGRDLPSLDAKRILANSAHTVRNSLFTYTTGIVGTAQTVRQ